MAFTRDWDESTPLGSDQANTIDNSMRNMEVDVSDRLKSMIYGFIAGENSLAANFKQVTFYEQASVTVSTEGFGALYGLAVSGVCQLHWQDEASNERQLTKAGGLLNVIAGDYLADSIDEDDIRLTNNAYLTARNAANSGDINCIKVNASDLVEILVGAVLSADTAPATDAAIANKKYVDDQVTAITDPTYTGGESHTYAGGKIEKIGTESAVGSVVFAVAFPNACDGVQITAIANTYIYVTTKATTGFTVLSGGSASSYYWTAVGY